MGQLKFFKRNAAKDVFLIIFQKFHNSSFSNFPEKCIKRFYIECLVNQMTLLQTFSRQISHYCRTIKRKHFSWSLCLLDSESLDCRVAALEKRVSFAKHNRGRVKNVSKKTTGSIGGMNFFLKQKKFL